MKQAKHNSNWYYAFSWIDKQSEVVRVNRVRIAINLLFALLSYYKFKSSSVFNLEYGLYAKKYALITISYNIQRKMYFQ